MVSIESFQSPGERQEQGGGAGLCSRMDCLSAELFLNNCFSDTVFVTLLRTVVETAISEVPTASCFALVGSLPPYLSLSCSCLAAVAVRPVFTGWSAELGLRLTYS